jgi:cytochrome b
MAADGEVKVWDPLVRVFHWSLVTAMATAWIAEDTAWLHENAGYVALGLVLFRIFWGIVGPKHARFGDFVKRPAEVKAYLRDLSTGRASRYLGHNPVGGVMIVLLLTSVLVTAGSGALSVTDAFWGTEWLEELHEGAANVTLFLVFVHVSGVVVSSLLHRENLVRAMVTGRKKADPV